MKDAKLFAIAACASSNVASENSAYGRCMGWGIAWQFGEMDKAESGAIPATKRSRPRFIVAMRKKPRVNMRAMLSRYINTELKQMKIASHTALLRTSVPSTEQYTSGSG